MREAKPRDARSSLSLHDVQSRISKIRNTLVRIGYQDYILYGRADGVDTWLAVHAKGEGTVPPQARLASIRDVALWVMGNQIPAAKSTASASSNARQLAVPNRPSLRKKSASLAWPAGGDLGL